MGEELGYFTDMAVRSDRVIYTPSEFAKENLFFLQEVGNLKALKPHSSSRENLESYLFFIVREGMGTVEYNGEIYKLSKGDCVFLDCSVKYEHKSSKDRLWSLQWVHFYGKSMNGIYRKYIERGGKPVFHLDLEEKYINSLNIIYALAESSDHIRDMRLNEQLCSLITLLMEQKWKTELNGGSKQAGLNDIKEYIEANYNKKITLDDLAEKFYINKFYLSKIFRECYGMTVNNYLMYIRITKAKQLLRFTDLSIETIGIQCGIEDVNYFSRVFKKIEGITPRKYRLLW